MKTEQINIRLEADLVAALERVAREEALDRTTAVRRLLETSIRHWEIDRALRAYQQGDVSLGRAAEEAGLTQWELMDAARRAGIAYPLDAEAAAPGRRAGLRGRAFVAAGHGLTDLVKRPTPSPSELTASELDEGADTLFRKIADWKPGLILFAFKEPARRLHAADVTPGPGAELAGVPTFLLSGPYAARAQRERVDAELRRALARLGPAEPAQTHSQRVTANDLARGQIRLKQDARALFPPERATVEVVLRGRRVQASYEPRVGPDRSRSPVLRVGAVLRELVRANESLGLARGLGGVISLD